MNAKENETQSRGKFIQDLWVVPAPILAFVSLLGFALGVKQSILGLGAMWFYGTSFVIALVSVYRISTAEHKPEPTNSDKKLPPAARFTRNACVGAFFAALICAVVFSRVATSPNVELADPTQLYSVEKNSFVFTVEDDGAQMESFSTDGTMPLKAELQGALTKFEDFFLDHNPKIDSAILEVKAELGSPDVHRGVTIVTGPAGSGKSFLKRTIKAKFEDVLSIGLCKKADGGTSHFCENANGLEFTPRDDLIWRDTRSNRNEAFNQLSAVSSPDLADWKFPHETEGTKPPKVVLIDDLDEIHQSSAADLLSAVDSFLAGGTDETELSNPLHIFVFGRPEAFAAFLTTDEESARTKWSNVISIQGPVLTSRSKLRTYLRNTVAYHVTITGKIKQEEANDALLTMWTNLIQMISDHPWIPYTMQNLDTADFICERAREKATWREHELKEEIVRHLFDRGKKTHGRPELRSDSRYRLLFEQIAVEHCQQIKTDGDQAGFFKPAEFIPVIERKAGRTEVIGEVSVERTLDHSGLAVLRPLNWDSPKYRMQPFWIHSYFIEKHNEALASGYEPGRYWSFTKGRFLRWSAGTLLIAAVVSGISLRKRKAGLDCRRVTGGFIIA